MPLTHIALGSNLSDPLLQLRRARMALAAYGRVEGASSLYRTTPVGGPPGQPDFLNAVVAFRPDFGGPEALLRALLGLELQQGRTRAVRWDARTLDLDLLAWDDLVYESPVLTLPHPRMMERTFVLAPLCEVAPDWRHPQTRERACEALARLGAEGVERTEWLWAGAN